MDARIPAVVLACLLLAAAASGAEVRNVSPGQDGNRIVFEYSLAGPEAEADVEVVLTVNGRSYAAKNLHLEGDFGRVAAGDGKRIYWNVLQDFPDGLSESFEWEIVASANGRAAARKPETKPALPKIDARTIRVEVTDGTGGNLPPNAPNDIAGEIVTRTRDPEKKIKASVVKGRNDGADVVLRVRIEEFDMGNATRRLMSLGLGGGRARLRYKVQLIDAVTQEIKRTEEFSEQNRNPFRTGSRIEGMMAGRIGTDCANFLSENVR